MVDRSRPPDVGLIARVTARSAALSVDRDATVAKALLGPVENLRRSKALSPVPIIAHRARSRSVMRVVPPGWWVSVSRALLMPMCRPRVAARPAGTSPWPLARG